MLAAAMRASLPTHDSIQEFEKARHDRLWDGMTLWLEGHSNSSAGAVYLLGYCVEMTLKCAYFRVLGLQVSDPITGLELRAAQAKASQYGVVARAESCHSVLFWCDLLREQRRAIGSPLEATLERQLIDESTAVYARWSVEMRYKTNYTSSATLDRVLQAAEWFDLNYARLHAP